MQNALSFALIADATTGGTGDLSSVGVRVKTENDAQTPMETGLFASFLSEWAQSLEQSLERLESGEMPADGSLDLTLSAEQGETREERTASLPLNCMNDASLLSSSVLDLMASIRNGLEEKGIDKDIDLDALSDQVGGELEKILPGMDLERLKAMLSRLQNRYPVAMRSDGARHLDIEVALPDDLTIGLEALLRPSQDMEQNISLQDAEQDTANNNAGNDNANNENEDAAALSSPLFKNDETDLSTSLMLSRLYAWLGPDVARSASDSKSESTDDVETSRREKNASSERNVGRDATAQVAIPVVSQEAEQGAFQEKSQKQTNEDGENIPRNRTQSRDESPAASSKAGQAGEEESAAVRSGTPVERKSTFERFFEGAAAARQDPVDVRPEPLDLTKGSALSRNETLSEGLDNVVRFIRAGGEQKASVIIDPPALGRISVELTNSATGLEASIKVGSEQVRQMVQDQIVQLRLSLEQQGVHLTHFSVDVQQENGQQHQETDRRAEKSARGISGKDDPDDAQDEQAMFRVDLNQGLLYWIA